MATFKVGQRVRLVGGNSPADPDDAARSNDWMSKHGPVRRGMTGVVVGPAKIPEYDYSVMIDGYQNPCPGWAAMSYQLAPLTDEESDTWAADKVRELVKPRPMDVEREPAIEILISAKRLHKS